MADKDRDRHYLGVDKSKLDYWGEEVGCFKRQLDKYMLLKKDGKAIHLMGKLTRHTYDAELIYVYNEIENDWIGQFCEGFGFFDVKFRKEDCRDANEEEIELFKKGIGETVKF